MRGFVISYPDSLEERYSSFFVHLMLVEQLQYRRCSMTLRATGGLINVFVSRQRTVTFTRLDAERISRGRCNLLCASVALVNYGHGHKKHPHLAHAQ